MSIKNLAKELGAYGREGDSLLLHVQPEEVAGLQALAKAQGTSLTINPKTGLPEAFSLGGFFKSLLPTIAGFAAAGMSGGAMSPMLAGILAGAGTGALTNKDPLSGALMGGLGGYGGANLFSAAKGFTPAAGATTAKSAGIDQTLNKVASSVGTTADQALLDPLVSQQISMYTPAGGTAQTAALGGAEATYGALTAPTAQTAIPGAYAPNFNPIAGATQGTGGYTPPSVFASDASALKTAAGNVAADPLGFAMQNKMGVGMPLGMAALSGLEPSDLYGEPMKPDNRGAYDPYSKLNLSGDTGLRLYAHGGPVSFADGGPSDKLELAEPAGLPGGGSDAMQGAGMLPLDVSDINAKYGFGEAGPVAPPKLGLFASNDQIENARTAYEQQLKQAASGRGGMGSFPGMGRMGGIGMQGGVQNIYERNAANQRAQGEEGPLMMRTVGVNNTAPTARTAETALSRLNLNRQYAAGGTISSGGIRDLYGSPDDQTNGVVLSRDGYGLGRLQAMADGGVAGYADGGNVEKIIPHIRKGITENSMERIPLPSGKSVPLSGNLSLIDALRMGDPKIVGYFDGAMSGSPAMQGGGLNLNADTGYRLAKGGYLDGPGDGMSDSIPATIEGKQPARLADGEFVVPADVVSHLGNGSTKAGSQRLYGMLDRVRKARTGTKKQGRKINADKYLPA